MKLISYEYAGREQEEWSFSKAELGTVNLLVGDSGSGKTRFLNTLFNLGSYAAGSKKITPGSWKVELQLHGIRYEWAIEIHRTNSGENYVKRERLSKRSGAKTDIIVERDQSFNFKGKELPKLEKERPSILLLKDEEEIKPLYQGFSSIIRRDFSRDELRKNARYDVVPPELLDPQIDDPADLWRLDFGLNLKLFVLSQRFPETYAVICDQYKDVFPFVKNCEVQELQKVRTGTLRLEGITPAFCIKEKHVNDWIPLPEWASGMTKVLLILTDVFTLPDGAIYLIDEYENSLGINAIDFFPEFLSQVEREIQFIITSHHPYIINNIPPENWLILNRRGSQVKIRYGKENAELFGRSKQQRFVQLINDPFYKEGVE